MIKFKWCVFSDNNDNNIITFNNHWDLFTFLTNICNDIKKNVTNVYFIKSDFYIKYVGSNEIMKPFQYVYGVYSDFDLNLSIDVNVGVDVNTGIDIILPRIITGNFVGFIFEEI